MKILAFDTCCGGYSIAFLRDAKIVASYTEEKNNQQSKELVLSINKLLQECQMTYQDLDYIAITIGPGSFTGIRIGIATAQGIAAVTGVPLIGVTTLEAFAYKGAEKILAAIDAGRNQYYCQEFFNRQPVSKPNIHNADEVDELARGKQLLGNYYDKATLPDAKDVAQLAFEMVSQSKSNFIAQDIMPFYIREPDAKLPKVGINE